MEAASTIRKMLAGNKIFVPSYQRAYSWETPQLKRKQKSTQIDVFLNDLNEYSKSNSQSPYYFGHFLFEEKQDSFAVIDGQQRLSTIVIFLSVLFKKLRLIRDLSEDEEDKFEDMIMRRSTYRFATGDYDNSFFKDYVINQVKADRKYLETESAKRVADAPLGVITKWSCVYLFKAMTLVRNF